jgi:pimeloyl-ACP methyl ester carboxylesterase
LPISRLRLGWMAVLLAAGLSMAALVGAYFAERNTRPFRDLLAPQAPSPLLDHPERAGVAGLRNADLRSPAGLRIAAWYAPSRNRAAIILTHGTNADRSSMLPELRLLADAGFGVIAFDWPGLGASEGPILWGAGARQTLAAAIDWLAERPEVDPQKIGGLGFSVGSFIMTQVAAGDGRLKAVVLEGTPASFDAYIDLHAHGGRLGRWLAERAISRSGLAAAEWAPQNLIGAIAPRPLLLVGGTRDTEIPPWMAQGLYADAREPKSLWIVPKAQHGGYMEVAPVEYPRRILAFFESGLAVTAISARSAPGSP